MFNLCRLILSLHGRNDASNWCVSFIRTREDNGYDSKEHVLEQFVLFSFHCLNDGMLDAFNRFCMRKHRIDIDVSFLFLFVYLLWRLLEKLMVSVDILIESFKSSV